MEADDLTFEEKRRLKEATLALERFEFTVSSSIEADKARFEEAARNEMGKAGFGVHVHWEEVVKRTPLGDIPTGVWCPSLQDIHRLKEPLETDHDRKRYEIVHGLDGGEPGFIREDGSIHDPDDPIKKLII